MHINTNSIENEILQFLSYFARTARYYNLNSMTQSENGSDPLSTYHRIFNRILANDVPKKKLQRITGESIELTRIMQPVTSVIGFNFERNLMSLNEQIVQSQLQHNCAGYVVVRLYKILKPLSNILASAGHSAQAISNRTSSQAQIPNMIEFFYPWIGIESKNLLSKRRWS
jgi:hypothetical protein